MNSINNLINHIKELYMKDYYRIYCTLLIVLLCFILWIDSLNRKYPIKSIIHNIFLAKRLWKIIPKLSDQEINILSYSDILIWRKFLIAGFMISITISAMTIKRIGILYAIIISNLVLILWLIFLFYFWEMDMKDRYLTLDAKEQETINHLKGMLYYICNSF